MRYVVYLPMYWVVAYFVMLETQTELVVQAAGYKDPTADCTLLWCSWTARSRATGALESGSAVCSPMLDCKITRRPAPP